MALEKFVSAGHVQATAIPAMISAGITVDRLKAREVMMVFEQEEKLPEQCRNFASVLMWEEPHRTYGNEFMQTTGRQWSPCRFVFKPVDSHRTEAQLKKIIGSVVLSGGKQITPSYGDILDVTYEDALTLWAKYGKKGWLYAKDMSEEIAAWEREKKAEEEKIIALRLKRELEKEQNKKK